MPTTTATTTPTIAQLVAAHLLTTAMSNLEAKQARNDAAWAELEAAHPLGGERSPQEEMAYAELLRAAMVAERLFWHAAIDLDKAREAVERAR